MSDTFITDEMIMAAFDGYNFGESAKLPEQRRRMVATAIMKSLCEYSNGRSMDNILLELCCTNSRGGRPIKAARQWMFNQFYVRGEG